MPSNNKTILNFGNSHVSASVFSETNGSLLLSKSSMETLHYNLNDEQAWLGASIAAVKKLIEKLNIKGNVYCILPGSMLLSKTIRIPHVEATKQKKIISFELSQKLPIPLSELIWDYLVIDDDGVEEEVLAYAVKPNLVEGFCEELIKSKVNPVLLTPSPILDYNLVSNFLIDPQKNGQEKILTVNIGAKSTNLLFIDENGFLIRTITIGGNMLTQSISDQLAIPFEKAESFKKNYFSGQIALEEGDPSLGVLTNASAQHVSRISQEITRALLHYKRIKKGSVPQQILLTGRGTIIGGLPEALAQNLQMSVTHLNPMQYVTTGESVNEEIKAIIPFMLSESTGLAQTLLVGSQKHKTINLLPRDKISAIDFNKKLPWIGASILLMSLCPAPLLLMEIGRGEELEKKLSEQSIELSDYESEFEVLNEKNKEMQNLAKLNSIIFEKQSQLQQYTSGNQIILEILNFLQEILDDPKIGDLWFDELKFKSDDSKQKLILVISGRYLVRIGEDSEEKNKSDALIELNTLKQNVLNAKIENHEKFNQIVRKTFSTEGKGDLFNKHFSYFEYELLVSEL
ncbi:MAG: hypothetical protein CMI24_05485 [Opitutae bacterium]|nr:hypothetical protein [Opitutae bacterium]